MKQLSNIQLQNQRIKMELNDIEFLEETPIENDFQLAARIANEDHIMKNLGTPPLLIAFDRMAWPEGDKRRTNRTIEGARKIVGWMKEEQGKEVFFKKDMSLLSKNLVLYIKEWKNKATEFLLASKSK